VVEERRRRRLSPDARREELLKAGKEVLRSKGADARVEDVTAAAGAAKGTFYVYFRTWAEFLEEIRREVDELVAQKFAELSRDYLDWRSVLLAFSKLHLQLIRELNGLEVIYYIPFEAGSADANLERTIAFLAEAHRAGAVDLDDPEVAGRLVFRMVINTTEAIVAGQEDERACDVCGQFIVAGLNARPVPRTDEFRPKLEVEDTRPRGRGAKSR
jgi:AcrR family transcriptional regulator